MTDANMHHRWVPAYVEDVQKHILKPCMDPTMKQTDKREIMINLQAQSN